MRKFAIIFSLFLIVQKTSVPQIPDGYYSTASGLSGEELKTALHDIIDDHQEQSYSALWDILIESDEDPQNSDNFILIYTGRSLSKSSTYPDWNREHIWAKSHGDFDNDPPAGTDAHHIRPCDVSVNSDRGNLDFDNGGNRHSEATGCYYDSDSWEPRDDVKGDIARMMFYMSVRYEGDISGEPDLELKDTLPTSGPYFGKLSTLLEWHKSDTADAFERNRNNVIYGYQNNRNPFIDHPDFVEKIWGDTPTRVNPVIKSTNKLSVYPNPADNYIILQRKIFSKGKIVVKLFNPSGKMVYSKQLQTSGNNRIKMDLPDIPRGTYIIKATSPGVDLNKKIILW